MTTLKNHGTGILLASALLCCSSIAQAVTTTYNFTITGDVLVGDEFFSNAFNLTAGETITAYGTFTADLDAPGNVSVIFASDNFNSLTIDVNGTLFSKSDDNNYGAGTGAFLTFNAGTLADFDFTSATFNSSFLAFDDFDSMYGEWTTVSLTAVPVPAAVWLFGSGLLGLVGIARRKTAA